jgi:hypothetical protein
MEHDEEVCCTSAFGSPQPAPIAPQSYLDPVDAHALYCACLSMAIGKPLTSARSTPHTADEVLARASKYGHWLRHGE